MTEPADDGTETDAQSQNTGSGNASGKGGGEKNAAGAEPARRMSRQQLRKQVLLRLDPAVYDALARWAAAELRSTNAQIDYLLRRALKDARRLPQEARPHPRRGRPPRDAAAED